MPKNHVCANGNSVVDQVLLYQSHKRSKDYVYIQTYYEAFKDFWYFGVENHIDRNSFNADFDWKLFRAVSTYSSDEATSLAKKYQWRMDGAFNRWFWRILSNWICNLKSNSYRTRKRPSVLCPICGRWVVRIDEEHLQHYKTKNDLPRCFVWKDKIYATKCKPSDEIMSWGKYSTIKFEDVLKSDDKKWLNKKVKCKWPWFKKGIAHVVCPFTETLLPEITNEYLRSLPQEHNRYAKRTSWQEFIETYSYSNLIESEVYSLEYRADPVDSLPPAVVQPYNVPDNFSIENYNENLHLENVYHIINSNIEDEKSREMLKLMACGYDDNEVSQRMNIDRREIRKRKKQIQDLVSFKTHLCNSLIC